MKKIDFIIAVKNRDNKRIQNCINSIKSHANEIFVIDYNSDKPIKVKDAITTRLEGENYKIWNKSHALNIGIKKSKSEYICTIDCDMILSEEILDSIEENLAEQKVIFNTNVRRIKLEDISDNYDKMLDNSFSWFEDGSRGNIYSKANGGIQVFPREWINTIGGYDEGLGLYWGAMDNRIYEQAKGLGMTIVDLNLPMLHQEHDKTKEFCLNEEEREFAEHVRAFKIGYLNELISRKEFISERKWGQKKPNHNWMLKLVKDWEKTVTFKKKIELDIKPLVYISITTNYSEVPIYFMMNLIKIMDNAKFHGIDIIVDNRKGAAVDTIRNMAVIDAINSGATHLLQLDIDHFYPNDLIIRLLEHKKDFVCGITTRRIPPYNQTQWIDAEVQPINKDGNICKFDGTEGLVKIGATGMVGSLIDINVFKKIDFPYYDRAWIINENKQLVETGEDVFFCRQLINAGIELWCDTSLSYPHESTGLFIDKGNIISTL